MRRALLPWLIALGFAVIAGVVTVLALNATVFGAGAFARVYLDALARGDVSEVLTLPGVDAGGKDAALLREGTTAGLTDIRQLDDEERGDRHLVTVGWTTPRGEGTTTFQLERIGTRFGLFPEWGFAVSPIATVALTVQNDARFTVNGADELSPARADTAVDYAVLVPGAYSFAHTSRYLTAEPDVVVADAAGQTLSATVDVHANADFVAVVSKLVHEQLTECTTQTVLFPTGCAFGQSVDDRVSGVPVWTIVNQPRIAIVPGAAFGEWAVPSTPGTAHLRVPVTSLFDGTTSEFDQDVPFRVRADVVLGADDSISVTER